MFSKLVLCFGVLTSRCLAQGAAIISGPASIAALAGKTVRFDCSVEFDGDGLEWRWYRRQQDSGQRIWFSGKPAEPEFLDVSQPTTFPTTLLADNSRHKIEIYQNNFDLIIHNVSKHDAGLYACRILLQSIDSSAYLFILQGYSCGSGRPNTVDQMVAEGDTVPLVCSVQSYGYGQMAPTLNWTSDAGSISSVHSVDGEKVTVSTEMTATVELNQKPLTCHLSFEDDGSQIAEPPTYSDSCVLSYNVFYTPRNTQTSPDATSVDGILRLMPGDSVSCSSSGNPQPRYSWFQQKSTTLTHQGSVLNITADMISSSPVTWTCRALNSFNGETYYFDKVLDILISYPSSTIATKPPPTQPPRTTTRPPPQPTPQPTPQPAPQPTPPTPQPTPPASSTAESLSNSNAQAQTDGGGGNGAVIGGAVAGVVVVIILFAAAATAYFFHSRRKVKVIDEEDMMSPTVSS